MKIIKEKKLLNTPNNIQINDLIINSYSTKNINCYKDGVYECIYKVIDIDYNQGTQYRDTNTGILMSNLGKWIAVCTEYMNRNGKIHKNPKAKIFIDLSIRSYDRVNNNHPYIIHKVKQLQDKINIFNSL